MKEFCGLRTKIYVYLIPDYGDDYDNEDIINKKAKRTKKCRITRRLQKDCFKTIQIFCLMIKSY